MTTYGSQIKVDPRVRMCAEALSCTDEKSKVPNTTDDNGNFKHEVDIKQTAEILGTVYTLMSFKRMFTVNWSESGQRNINAVVQGTNPETFSYVEFFCENKKGYEQTGQMIEDCTQSFVIPMYLNMRDKVFVYRKVVETIRFVANTSANKAKFKTKGGFPTFFKFVIKKQKDDDPEFLVTNEEFHVVRDGVDTIVHKATKNTNPFDVPEPFIVWGLNGEQRNAVNDETFNPLIRQLLLWPIPPSMSIARDLCGSECAPSVNNYGYYNYNEIGDGFEKLGDALAALDGGKDYYYPLWLRRMTPNPIMEEYASRRWWGTNRYTADYDTYFGNKTWTPPDIITDGWPFGSFAVDNNGNYIFSALFTDINDNVKIFNESNAKDVFTNIKLLGQEIHSDEGVCYPITIISNPNMDIDKVANDTI